MKYSNKTTFDPDVLEYDFQMKRRKPWWLLLLLLLPFLLLIRFQHDLEVTCLDSENSTPIIGTDVILSYQDYYIYKGGQFFGKDSILMTQPTDSTGSTTFRNLPGSVFSLLCGWLSRGTIDVHPECYGLEEAYQCFVHYHRHITLPLQPVTVSVPVQVIDLETEEPIPGITIRWADGYHQEAQDSLVTDPVGRAVIGPTRYCGQLQQLRCTGYGYADTLVQQVDVRPWADAASPLVVRMRPIKASFAFTVLNAISHQPIPQATVEVKLVSRGGSSDTGSATTNVDGLGRGFYGNGAILSSLDLLAGKAHYKPGQFDWTPYREPHNVDHFTQLPDSQRVIYLEPEPYVVEFVVLDSLTHRPIAGVTNAITITHLDGSRDTIPAEVSNSNGVFPIKAMEGETIDILSTLDPEYVRKHTRVVPFMGPDTIYLKSNFQTLTFRTLLQGTEQLLPNCHLNVRTQSGTRSGFPTSSGNGVFTISQVLPNDRLYISASKNQAVNQSKINGQSVHQLLSASQSERDIPLPIEYRFSSADQGLSEQDYDMGKGPYRFRFNWELCENCTLLTLLDGGTVIATIGFHGETCALKSGEMIFNASSSNLHIKTNNINGHSCTYRIKRL